MPDEKGSTEKSRSDPPAGSLEWFEKVEARADELGDLMLDLYEQEKAKGSPDPAAPPQDPPVGSLKWFGTVEDRADSLGSLIAAKRREKRKAKK